MIIWLKKSIYDFLFSLFTFKFFDLPTKSNKLFFIKDVLFSIDKKFPKSVQVEQDTQCHFYISLTVLFYFFERLEIAGSMPIFE